jgi:CRISPR-associated protein Csy1
MESVFDRLFGSRQRVKELTRNLREFLTRVAEVNNIGVREARASMVEDIRDELFQFTAELYELAPGWTRHQDCRLNIDEQCWLDHDRAASDEAFAAAVRSADWQEGICRRFGNWLNARLTNPKMPMGQAEADEWKSVLDKELRMVRLEIEDHD